MTSNEMSAVYESTEGGAVFVRWKCVCQVDMTGSSLATVDPGVEIRS